MQYRVFFFSIALLCGATFTTHAGSRSEAKDKERQARRRKAREKNNSREHKRRKRKGEIRQAAAFALACVNEDHKCAMCSRIYCTASELQTHMRQPHYSCELCDAIIPGRGLYIIHLEAICTGNK